MPFGRSTTESSVCNANTEADNPVRVAACPKRHDLAARGPSERRRPGCREHRDDLRSRQDELRQCRVARGATSCPCKMRRQQDADAGQGPNADGCSSSTPVRHHVRLLTSTPATMPGNGIDARLQAPQLTKKCEPLKFSECPPTLGKRRNPDRSQLRAIDLFRPCLHQHRFGQPSSAISKFGGL